MQDLYKSYPSKPKFVVLEHSMNVAGRILYERREGKVVKYGGKNTIELDATIWRKIDQRAITCKIYKNGPDEDREESTELEDHERRKFYKEWSMLWIPILPENQALTPTMLILSTLEPFDIEYPDHDGGISGDRRSKSASRGHITSHHEGSYPESGHSEKHTRHTSGVSGTHDKESLDSQGHSRTRSGSVGSRSASHSYLKSSDRSHRTSKSHGDIDHSGTSGTRHSGTRASSSFLVHTPATSGSHDTRHTGASQPHGSTASGTHYSPKTEGTHFGSSVPKHTGHTGSGHTASTSTGTKENTNKRNRRRQARWAGQFGSRAQQRFSLALSFLTISPLISLSL